ncbi:MAG: pentapeptide repeat-containing protein [Bacteroidales bacterium]|nr:pentapeptide repeat-containing protein [Bacteroidales bacterium]
MINLKYFGFTIFLLLFAIGLITGCKQYTNPVVNNLFPHPPDTTNMLYLSNFTSKDIRKSVINEEIFLEDGTVRKKGLASVPQDYDDFRSVDLDEVYWKGEQVVGGDFRGTSFRSAKCNGGVFTNSNFRFCDIRWSVFNNSDLSNCKFCRATLFRMFVNDAILDNSDFRGANMFGVAGHRANFRNCDFTNALMKESEFLNADFTGSKAVNVKFIITVFAGAKLDSMDLSYSDFTGAGLEDVSFVHSRLINADFRGAHLQGANFKGANLSGCNFFAAEFVNTIFTGAINIPKGIEELIEDGQITGLCYVNGNDI